MNSVGLRPNEMMEMMEDRELCDLILSCCSPNPHGKAGNVEREPHVNSGPDCMFLLQICTVAVSTRQRKFRITFGALHLGLDSQRNMRSALFFVSEQRSIYLWLGF